MRKIPLITCMFFCVYVLMELGDWQIGLFTIPFLAWANSPYLYALWIPLAPAAWARFVIYYLVPIFSLSINIAALVNMGVHDAILIALLPVPLFIIVFLTSLQSTRRE